MFGRATIRLGIGPHSSCLFFSVIFVPKMSKSVHEVIASQRWDVFETRCISVVKVAYISVELYCKRMGILASLQLGHGGLFKLME